MTPKCPCCNTPADFVRERIVASLKLARADASTREQMFQHVKEIYSIFEEPADSLISMDMETMKKCMSDGNKQYLCDEMVFTNQEPCPMM
jgi:hypothetical protein